MLVKIGSRADRAHETSLVALLASCHEKIRAFSALAVALASRDDLGDADVIDGCVRCERYFEDALPLHVTDEDESLGPRLREVAPDVVYALEAMSSEHAQHVGAVAALCDALRAMRETGSSPVTRAALYAVASPLERAFAEHLALEERVIFPAISARLSAESQAAIVRELRARRSMPPA